MSSASSTTGPSIRTSRPATFRWLDGTVEAVLVDVVRDGRAYVSWPDSVREIPALGPGLFQRPSGWVDAARIEYREVLDKVSPEV